MKILLSLTTFFILFSPTVGLSQIGITEERIYLHTTIKTYPVAEGRPLLQYLRAERPVADRAMQLIAEGKIDALYESMATAFKNEVTASQFQNAFQAMEQSTGKIIFYEYRNQALLYPNDNTPMSELGKAKSQVWYTIKTTKMDGSGIFIAVKTMREGNKHVVSNINFLNYGERIPPWLLYTDAPARK